MTKVICLVGASGSGKTTIAKELEDKYNIIQSYTTRPQRESGEWGHTFIGEVDGYGWKGNKFEFYDWLDAVRVDIQIDRSEMIGYKEIYGDIYFATDEQVIRNMTNIYIVDPEGAEQVHELYKGSDVEVITVYLQVDEQERRDRMINRSIPTVSQFRSGKTYSHQALLKEVSSRLESDRLLFQIVKCDYVIDGNRDIEEVKKDLVAAIERL